MSSSFNINREKMITGQVYDGTDRILWDERRRVKLLCHKFNSIIPPYAPEDVDAYQQVLKELLPNASPDVFIEPTLRCDYGYNIYIDEQVYINCEAHLDDCAPIRIGKRCFFGPAVHIYTATHPIHAQERSYGYEFAKPVTIGDDTWLCGRATICPGVTIGRRCVIAAGAVVTKDIPDDSLVAGVPAKVIRKITDADKMDIQSREGIHPHLHKLEAHAANNSLFSGETICSDDINNV